MMDALARYDKRRRPLAARAEDSRCAATPVWHRTAHGPARDALLSGLRGSRASVTRPFVEDWPRTSGHQVGIFVRRHPDAQVAAGRRFGRQRQEQWRGRWRLSSVPAGCSSTRSGSRSRLRRAGHAGVRAARVGQRMADENPDEAVLAAHVAASETVCRVLPEVFAFELDAASWSSTEPGWCRRSWPDSRSTTPTSLAPQHLVPTGSRPRWHRLRQSEHQAASDGPSDLAVRRLADGRGSAPRLPGARPAAVRDPRGAGHLRARHSVRSWDVRTSTSMLILNRWIRAGRCGAARTWSRARVGTKVGVAAGGGRSDTGGLAGCSERNRHDDPDNHGADECLAAQDASQVAASAGAATLDRIAHLELPHRCHWQTRSATPRCSPDDKADDRGGVPVRRGDHAEEDPGDQVLLLQAGRRSWPVRPRQGNRRGLDRGGPQRHQ